jgi:hypothetical protein
MGRMVLVVGLALDGMVLQQLSLPSYEIYKWIKIEWIIL